MRFMRAGCAKKAHLVQTSVQTLEEAQPVLAALALLLGERKRNAAFTFTEL